MAASTWDEAINPVQRNSEDFTWLVASGSLAHAGVWRGVAARPAPLPSASMFGTSNAFYLGHLGKTPVYVAPEAALNLILVWMMCDQTLPGFVVVLMAFLIAVLVHESGHAILARAQGMSGISITLAAFGGFCSYHGDRKPTRELPIILAGCAFNLLTALGLYLAAQHLLPLQQLDPLFQQFARTLFWFSLFLGLFNLLPIYPLDGGQATLAISRLIARNDANARRFTLSMSVAGAIGAVAILGALHMIGMFTFFILAMLLFAAFRDLR
jgi:Zn-dependent protease